MLREAKPLALQVEWGFRRVTLFFGHVLSCGSFLDGSGARGKSAGSRVSIETRGCVVGEAPDGDSSGGGVLILGEMSVSRGAPVGCRVVSRFMADGL